MYRSIPVLLFAALLCAAFIPAKKSAIPLQEAIDNKLVEAQLTGLGGYSGDCVRLKLTNNTNKNLELMLPEGTLLHPDDPGDQTLLMPEQQILALEKSDRHSYKLPGYCTEASDASPAEGSGFAMAAATNKTMAALAAYINEHPELLKYDDAVQSAVWAVSNNHGVSSIYEPDAPAVNELRAKVCELTGKRNVWYNTRTNRRMLGDRTIVSDPVEVNGRLTLTSDKPMKVTSKVINDKNEVMFDMGDARNFRKGTANFTFRIQVKGWAEGTYHVVYLNQADTVLKQPFLIEA